MRKGERRAVVARIRQYGQVHPHDSDQGSLAVGYIPVTLVEQCAKVGVKGPKSG